MPWSLFERHLHWLLELGVEVTSVRAALASSFPAGTVSISFDDGLTSAARACAAILERGWSATLFVVPGWVGGSRPGHLTWSDVVELAEQGIEVGTHGMAHERLCRFSRDEQRQVLIGARSAVEDRIGRAVSGTAYPHGLFDRVAVTVAAEAGYAYACTTLPGRNRPRDPYRLRRNEVVSTDRTLRSLRAKLAGADDWFAPVGRWEVWLRCRRGSRDD